MTDEERRTAALDHASAAKKAIQEADVHPDPVMQRRLQVRAAGHYRIAAQLLDDNGRLTE